MACIRGAQSHASDVSGHVAALRSALSMPDLRLVMVFMPCNGYLPDLAQALTQAFAPAQVVGCSSAGGIGPRGYLADSVTAIGFGGPDFLAQSVLLPNLSSFDVGQASRSLRQTVDHMRQTPLGRHRLFALSLYDGVSGAEEIVASAVHALLGSIPICGGSAGDDVRFQKTYVLHQGELHNDCALITLIATNQPIHVFKTEHFSPSSQRLVITAADPARRTVTEIDGLPAALAYARLIGTTADQLSPSHYARHPVMVRVNGTNFIRSVQRVNDDGSLTFFCAIDTGLVMRLAHGNNMEDDLAATLAGFDEPQLIIGFDCLFRNLELSGTPQQARIERLWADHNIYGFSTFGEQFQGMHINQTLTGVAIGHRGMP